MSEENKYSYINTEIIQEYFNFVDTRKDNAIKFAYNHIWHASKFWIDILL